MLNPNNGSGHDEEEKSYQQRGSCDKFQKRLAAGSFLFAHESTLQNDLPGSAIGLCHKTIANDRNHREDDKRQADQKAEVLGQTLPPGSFRGNGRHQAAGVESKHLSVHYSSGKKIEIGFELF
jgi:hypothetical protein